MEKAKEAKALKKVLFVQQRAPYGSLFGREGLDAILMGSAFVDCSVYFSGDGVFQILKNQEPDGVHLKNYSVTYEALNDYGVTSLFVLDKDLEERGINGDDLLVEVEVLSSAKVTEMFHEHEAILSF